MTRIPAIAFATLSGLLLAPAALADDEAHLDVWVQQDSTGAIDIGAIEEGGGDTFAGVRVFGAEFGEDPAFPFYAFEPGFEALDGTFDPFTTLRFDLTESVLRWNGDGFDDTDEVMTLSFGPNSVTSGDGFTSGFTFGADDEGGFHDHFDIELDDPFGGDPDPAIYLLSMTLSYEDGAGTSPEFWFVMNLGQEEADHEASIEWVELNLVPGPGGVLLMMLGGLGAAGRRRRA